MVVEDDRSLGTLLKHGLELEGYRVQWAADGESALEYAANDCADLILLDLSLPKRDGVEVLTELRLRNTDAAVLVLSGRLDVNAKMQCFELGADDYLVKPFSFRELKARCKVLLKRRQQVADPMLRCSDVELNRIDHKVTRSGRLLNLTSKEYLLLEYLMLRQGECVTRKQLLAEVWQTAEQTGTNVVDVYVNYLRRKLQGGDELIETVRGAGYRLRVPLLKPAAKDTAEAANWGRACA
jgi:DNA-binding response OmpR family regulator